MDDDIWLPFVETTFVVDQLPATSVLRRFIKKYLDDLGIFRAPVSPTDPQMVTWYDCEECDRPHRLDGVDAPWGCSLTKALQDRAKATNR